MDNANNLVINNGGEGIDAFEAAKNLEDLEKIFYRDWSLEYDAVKMADYLEQARGDCPLGEFAKKCKEMIKDHMEPGQADRCGASASTFTRIAKGNKKAKGGSDDEEAESRRPLDLRLLWAIWMARDEKSVTFTREDLFKASRYGLKDERNKNKIKNAGKMDEYEATQSVYEQLVSGASFRIMDRISRSGYAYQMFRNQKHGGTLLPFGSLNDNERESLINSLNSYWREYSNSVFGNITELAGKYGYSSDKDDDMFKILNKGIVCGDLTERDLTIMTHSTPERLILKVQGDESLFWSLFFCQPVSKHSEKEIRMMMSQFKPILLRDQLEPFTLPDFIIKNTFVCIDKSTYKKFKKLIDDFVINNIQINSLISVMYVDPNGRDDVEEFIIPRKDGKIPESFFPSPKNA